MPTARSVPFLAFACLLAMVVSACGGGSSGSTNQHVPQPFFTVAATPQTPLLEPGNSAAIVVPVLGWNGFSGVINVTVSGLPSGVTATPSSFSVQSPQGPPDVTVTLSAAGSMPDGIYSITLNGVSGALTGSATVTIGVVTPAQPSAMATPKPLFTFADSVIGSLIADSVGNFYGYEFGGEESVFQLSPSGSNWQKTTLYTFPQVSGGVLPVGALVMDAAGNLYGVTNLGGLNNCGNGCGTIFELSPSLSGWQYTNLYNFTGGSDGANPEAGLTLDKNGDLYGTAQNGGSANSSCSPTGCGTVFKLIHSAGTWSYSVIYTFQSDLDAAYPQSPLILDQQGNLYGTSSGGGNGNCIEGGGCGTVFRLSPSGSSWNEAVLYDFQGTYDGARPTGLVLDSSGNFYGTTLFGGFAAQSCNVGAQCGNFFHLSPSGATYTFSSDFYFTGNGLGYESQALVSDGAGDVYGAGAAGTGGEQISVDCGALFKLSSGAQGWTETSYYDFPGSNQWCGAGGLSWIGGRLYGFSTPQAGATGSVLFEVTP